MTIDEWVEKGCDYNTGVEIFAQLSNNKPFINFLRGGDPRFAERKGKLFHHLMKLKPKAGDVPVNTGDPVKPLPPKAPPKVVIESTSMDVKIPLPHKLTITKTFEDGELTNVTAEAIDTYPPVIQSAINMLSSFYKEKAKLWKEREELGYDNSSNVVAKRKALSDSIFDITNKMDLLYKIRNDYFTFGIVPENVTPSSITIENKDELPNTVEDLKTMKKNVQTNIAKDRNRLEYQNPNKQKVKTPIPSGPKRTTIEKRIEERLELVKKIDEKLKSLNVV
jgi:hypothetical protein